MVHDWGDVVVVSAVATEYPLQGGVFGFHCFLVALVDGLSEPCEDRL